MPSRKKLIFSSLVGLALIAFTGCTTGDDAEAGMKCQAGKCQTGKFKGAPGTAKKVVAKCSGGKCGSK